ncbi:helix-turn-helix domain-containing protein [Streptomyces sp. NPDC046985]|uniref:helix-turn-helix domain-containing protein n=1 Tax=Streptomyces sp. NPDC046985 TaxID=3155377 RepID=UPI0033EAE42B
MAYRVHFTALDLARTRVAENPTILPELGLAVRTLQQRGRHVRFDSWRRCAAAKLSAPARAVLALIPPVGWSPTFLMPDLRGGAEEVLERVRATPAQVIDAEMARLARHQPLPGWTRRLVDDAELRHHVLDAVAELHALLMEPYWARLTPQFTADRSLRYRHFLTGGTEGLLLQANPRWMTWKPPVLEIRMANGVEYDLHLQGQGVLLVPSAWFGRTLVDDATVPQPTVTYPLDGTDPLDRITALTPPADRAGAPRHVHRLLGHTRARVLDAVAEHPGCSTAELAAAASISPASASEHATTLREAGLIRTGRHRNTAVHTPTPLGIALLNQPDHT